MQVDMLGKWEMLLVYMKDMSKIQRILGSGHHFLEALMMYSITL